MDNPNQRPANRMTGSSGRPPMRPPQGPRPPQGSVAGGIGMTPKEIVGILRRHVWMIIIFVVLGTMIGAGLWYYYDRYLPKYTSVGTVHVDMPITQDPFGVGTATVSPSLYHQFRVTKAELIKQDYMFRELLTKSEKIKDTVWFKKFAEVNADGRITGGVAKAFDEAVRNLSDNLRTTAPEDYNYILVSMSCANGSEAKLIVDEMVRIFLRQQQELAQSGLKSELAQLNAQRDKIQDTLNQIEASLESIRSGTQFARLNLGPTQAFRDYVDEKVSDLEQQNTQLESDKERLESVISTLKAKTEGDFDSTVQEQVENDPIARQMRSQICFAYSMLSLTDHSRTRTFDTRIQGSELGENRD